jgi:hypothetical protein
MQRPIVLKYWRIIRYKTLIIQCVPEGKPEKRFCYESSVGKPCAFTGKACTDFKCIDRADGLRVLLRAYKSDVKEKSFRG